MLAEIITLEKALAAVVAIGGVAWTAWRKALKPRVVDACAFIGRVNSAVSLVESELRPNGGGSLKDEVRLVAAQTQALASMFERPVFQADVRGEYIRVNRAYRDLVSYGGDDLLGMGWVHVLHPDDRDRVVIDWLHMVADRRMGTIATRLVSSDGEVIPVRIYAEPMRSPSGVLGWFGTVHVEGEAAP